MSDAGEFIDYTLQRESSWEKAFAIRERVGPGLKVYGASVGAVRGTVRDALKRYKNLDHDQITALSSELWAEPVFERRLAAVVLLQSKAPLLDNTDLTRLEGFFRNAGSQELTDPLAHHVLWPLVQRLDGQNRLRAERVLARWAADPDPALRRAAAVVADCRTP
ncbi:DNA alkylation repair protein [Paenarthrobacter ureafaciens]|uniref:DNA alkylation repair protein n=1 Tax=Paenarthrobacter ureafaciens TaxID=37931 RepID=UPI0019175A97|nr:DNA alkylation repair protein [Paenarthrobacter ureafaciens]QQQ60985.1 DNA alkylation repair protein [Paenarthrobacter ureafaciens]